jgi:predicted permease
VGDVSAERLFAALLLLFPREFRERFGQDMRELFADELRAARARGSVTRLLLRTVPAVARAACVERVSDLTYHAAHAAGSDGMLQTLGSDVRYAARMLRKSPAFTLVAALVIALGSGAVATIFSAMNAMLLRPLPGATDAGRLVRVERVRRDGTGGSASASYPYYDYLRTRARTLSGVIAWTKVPLTLSAGGEGAAMYGNLVSGDFFAVLGVRPALGRFFLPEEGQAELAHPVIVVSEAFWRARLGADSGVVGHTVSVNGNPYTLVGVAPAAFAGLDAPIRTDAWVPLAMTRQLRPQLNVDNAGGQWLRLAGRLRDGADAATARAELAALTRAWIRSGAEPDRAGSFDDARVDRLSGLPSDASGALGGFLALLLGAAALVLLIASVNVASMLSARAIARRREMAVRAALGAGRARLVRQLLTEILALFAMGALGGVALSAAATGALERMRMPTGAGNITIALELSPDGRVLAFALGVSLLAGLAFGLAPALQGARRDVSTRLRDDTAGGGRRTRGTNALVVGQLALSLLLLVGAGLFLRALDRGRHIDPGFDNAGVAVAPFDAESWGYDEAKGRAFYDALRERVAALPGVSAVAYAEHLPLVMHRSGDDIQVGEAAPNAGVASVNLTLVDGDYFGAIRLPLVRGRAFGRVDAAAAPKVAVVNETLARRYWPAGDAVGRTFGLHGERVTVVGVARDAKYATLTETSAPMVYLPLAQHWRSGRQLLVRAGPGAESLGPALRAVVRDLDPALPRPTVSTLRAENGIVLLPQRVAAIVTGALGAVGLLLASVGLYGVIAYSVGRRAREIGIRLAIGARRGDVLAMVLRDGMRLAGLGVAIGLALGAAASRLVANLLFDVSPLDAATFGAMSALFVGVALLASWLPARRAAMADPKAALRLE